MTLPKKVRFFRLGFPPHFMGFRSPNLASGNCCIVCELLALARSAVEGANNTCDRRRTNSWQALEKAVFRVIATIIGVALFAIMALFSQTRDLLLIAYAGWMGLCVYVAGLFDGNRAYAAVLSGFTVALVVIQQIDNPELVFEAGMMRGAGILVGIASLAIVSDLLWAPNRHTELVEQLADIRHRNPSLPQCVELIARFSTSWSIIVKSPRSIDSSRRDPEIGRSTSQ